MSPLVKAEVSKELFLVFVESLQVRSCCWCCPEKPSETLNVKCWKKFDFNYIVRLGLPLTVFLNSCQVINNIWQHFITVNRNIPTSIIDAQKWKQHHCFTSVNTNTKLFLLLVYFFLNFSYFQQNWNAFRQKPPPSSLHNYSFFPLLRIEHIRPACAFFT